MTSLCGSDQPQHSGATDETDPADNNLGGEFVLLARQSGRMVLLSDSLSVESRSTRSPPVARFPLKVCTRTPVHSHVPCGIRIILAPLHIARW